MTVADTQYFAFYVSIPLDVTVYHHKTLIRRTDKGSHLKMIWMVMVMMTTMMMMMMIAMILETKCEYKRPDRDFVHRLEKHKENRTQGETWHGDDDDSFR